MAVGAPRARARGRVEGVGRRELLNLDEGGIDNAVCSLGLRDPEEVSDNSDDEPRAEGALP